MLPVVMVTWPNTSDTGRIMWSGSRESQEVKNPQPVLRKTTAVYSPLPVGMGGRSSGAGDWQVMLVSMTMAGWGGRSPKMQDRDSASERAGSSTTDSVTLEITYKQQSNMLSLSGSLLVLGQCPVSVSTAFKNTSGFSSPASYYHMLLCLFFFFSKNSQAQNYGGPAGSWWEVFFKYFCISSK